MLHIPEVGAAGLFTLQAPFDSMLVPNKPYTCVAVRQLREIILHGDDPYTKYYLEPHNIPETKYHEDLKNGAAIISLQSSEGVLVSVPTTYVVSYPIPGGVPYQVLALAISLSALPSNINLSALKTKIKNIVDASLGIESVTKELIVSQVEMVSRPTHEALEAARAQRITDKETDYYRCQRLTAELDAVNRKLKLLEKYVIDNGITPKI